MTALLARRVRVPLAAALVGWSSVYWIVQRHAVLVPDTASYAHGGSAWSSPLAALIGRLDGYHGLQLAGVCGAIAVAYLAGSEGRRWWFAALVMWLPSREWAIASCDALGAAACAIAYLACRSRSRPRDVLLLVLAVAVVHLEAACVLAATLVLGRWVRHELAAIAAGLGAIAALALIGYAIGVQPDELQLRYLLPGLLLAALKIDVLPAPAGGHSETPERAATESIGESLPRAARGGLAQQVPGIAWLTRPPALSEGDAAPSDTCPTNGESRAIHAAPAAPSKWRLLGAEPHRE